MINTFMLEQDRSLVEFVNQMTKINKGGPSSPPRTSWASTCWWTTCPASGSEWRSGAEWGGRAWRAFES